MVREINSGTGCARGNTRSCAFIAPLHVIQGKGKANVMVVAGPQLGCAFKDNLGRGGSHGSLLRQVLGDISEGPKA
jgi:hypothetical protein